MTTKELKRAHKMARATLAGIVELIEKEASIAEGIEQEQAQQEIQEWPLSVEVRSDWHTPSSADGNKPTEYKILLTTGGPAIQIVGDLDEYQFPETAKLQYQDWFTPWTDYAETTDEEDKTLLAFAREFYYGE